MASTVNATVSIQATGQNNLTTGGISYSGKIAKLYEAALSATSSPVVNKMYFATLSVTTSQTLVLNNGSLTDGYGEALTFTNVVYLSLHNNDASKTFTVGGGSNALIPAISLTAGGTLALKSTLAVSGAFNLVLAVTGTASIDVLILGN